MDYVEEFFTWLGGHPEYNKDDIAKLKIELCKIHGRKNIPTDIELLLSADQKTAEKFRKRMQTKPNRSLSGVAPVAIMTSPARCPHGKCTMCPGGMDGPWGDTPQSYTGAEPATMRGIRSNFDSYLQVFNRLEQYLVTGHVADKVDLIIMGGTFTARDESYQDDFVKYAFKAMNDFSEMFFREEEFLFDKFKEFFELPGDVGNDERTKRLHQKLLEQKGSCTLIDEQLRNENSHIRCIGLTIETKPDWAFLEHGNRMLEQGCTRVELGVQSPYDDALKKVHRGHDSKDNVKAIRILKDLGFKINYHVMLGLPGVNRDDDIKALKQYFDDSNYRPDMIKIYPCMVMPGTPLIKDFEEGKFNPITTEEAADIITEAIPFVQPYCRIMRVQRDIPTYRTIAGVDRTNLRQYVEKMMDERGVKSRDIRARESGRNKIAKESELVVLEFDASEGKEYFISFEDTTNDVLIGFCRLRFPSQQLRPEFTPSTAIIRELHVYGSAVALGTGDDDSSQHKGFGKQLLAKAEEIAKNAGYDKMLVISGVGVREYYRKFGYVREGPYVGKRI